MPIRGSRRPNVVPITAPSFSTPPRSYLYRKIAFGFIGLTIILVGAILWLSSVRAQVVVHVKKQPVSLDTVVELAKTPAAGQLIGRVTQGTFENRKEFPIPTAGSASATTPVVLLPSTVTTPSSTPAPTSTVVVTTGTIARGTVKIINNYSKPQTLVKTTRLLTSDNKLFRIDKNVTVPAGGSVEVSAYADKPGAEFAIGPTKFTIPGLYVDLQKLIYAESKTSFSLQTVQVTPVTPTKAQPTVPTRPTATKPGALTPSQDVIDAAERIATDETLDRAKRQLASEVTESASLEGVYFTKIRKEILPGSTPQSFIVYVQADVTAVYYPKDDMLVLVRTKLREKVPSDRELIPFDDTSIRYQIESVDPRTETATIRVQADASAQLTSTSDALKKENMTGKSKQELINTLDKVDGIESVDVTTSPGWLRKIPTMPERIDLKIE